MLWPHLQILTHLRCTQQKNPDMLPTKALPPSPGPGAIRSLRWLIKHCRKPISFSWSYHPAGLCLATHAYSKYGCFCYQHKPELTGCYPLPTSYWVPWCKETLSLCNNLLLAISKVHFVVGVGVARSSSTSQFLSSVCCRTVRENHRNK